MQLFLETLIFLHSFPSHHCVRASLFRTLFFSPLESVSTSLFGLPTFRRTPTIIPYTRLKLQSSRSRANTPRSNFHFNANKFAQILKQNVTNSATVRTLGRAPRGCKVPSALLSMPYKKMITRAIESQASQEMALKSRLEPIVVHNNIV